MFDAEDTEKLEGWVTGFACCRVCAHTWVAVVPVNGELSNLECPECHSMSGELTE
jgi:hypothetical protein